MGRWEIGKHGCYKREVGYIFVCCVCMFVCLVEELLAQFCNNFGTHKYLGFPSISGYMSTWITFIIGFLVG